MNQMMAVLYIPQLVDIGVQVAAGMAYLEEMSCIHRARNILVSEDLKCKLAGFGLAYLCEEDIYEAQTGANFLIKRTAPEAALYSRFTIKSDMWSFGILLYKLVTHGKSSYSGMTNAQVLQEIQAGYCIACPVDCPEKVA